MTRCWNDSSFLRIGKDGDEENAETIPDVVGFSHYWWVPGTLVTTGSTVDVVLPNGSHMIALVTKDSDGHLDATAITYARTCR
ncbi:hypothetical protein SAMN02745121_01054 [Nannocystis exedens]|uniref:Uncharacterized protein n=1 Tax=Nannocystis exedens TaxID=54 RepID=A0A1I1U8F7_9BACT|nr:hypothetical protein NAEX_04586 [Nannocystis exedens]SFD67151.1 hypothetical protein SAMN02745121_01054 [Nannocystis exedens]